MDEIHVFLSILEFDPAPPAEVTALLGLQPTAAWVKGDLVPGHPHADRPCSAWRIQSPLPRTATFEDQLHALLDILETRADQVRAASKRYGAQLTCAAYFDSVNPGFGLAADDVARIAALGLSMDFDLYCLAGAADAADPSPPSTAV
jgi:hypothetical protein